MDEMVTTAGIEHSNERANDVRSSARTEQIEVRGSTRAAPMLATG